MAFDKIKISSQEAQATPARVFYESETVEGSERLIPDDYETALRKFFVVGKDGEEFGEYETEEKAIDIAVQATQHYEMKSFAD